MNKTNRPGSISLFVIFVLTGLVLYCISSARIAGFLLDFEGMYIKTVKQSFAAKGLLQYGITIGANEYDALKKIIKDNQEQTILLPCWPRNTKNEYKGKITFSVGTESDLKIKAELYDNKKSLCGYQCVLKKHSNTFEIDNWEIVETL